MAGARTWRKAPKMIADALIAHLPALDGGVFCRRIIVSFVLHGY